jgi:hypothetical protein
MPDEKLVFALEQKVLLLKKISDLTKQIEVRSKQKEIRLEDLPAQRQVLLDRVEKCNRMIDGCVEALPEESRGAMKRILEGKADPGECGPDDSAVLQYSLKCRSLLRTILAENSVAVGRISEERNRLQKLLGGLREHGNAAGMFHHYSR